MSLFTDDFFNNIKTTKSNKTSKKKKDDEDESYTSFTESFFDNSYDEYYKSAGKSQYPSHDNTVYSNEFINEYNSFIDRMNKGAKERYDERVAKTESATLYYAGNKDNIVRERSKNLIYNWNLDDSGGVYNDYGAVPVQDKNGYLKKTDKDGNVYWVDIKKDLLYDDNYKLINDDRLKDGTFINGLKYEYNEKNRLDKRYLSKADKIGLTPIDKNLYMTLVNEQLYNKKTTNFDENPIAQNGKDKYSYINDHTKDGWIIDSGKYYKPINYSPSNFDEKKNDDSKFKSINGKIYEVVNNEIPKQSFKGFQAYNVHKSHQFWLLYFAKIV